MDISSEKALMHYGTKRHSGRYPWGSGKNPYQHSGDWISRVENFRAKGMSDTEIAEMLNLSTTKFRDLNAIAQNRRRQLEVEQVRSLKADGLNNSEIGRIIGRNESSVRSLLDENRLARTNQYEVVANLLKKEIDKKGAIDISAGVERELNISDTKLRQAATLLELQGYKVYPVGVPQTTNPGQQTIVRVISRPDITQGDCYRDNTLIKPLKDYYSPDGGSTFKKVNPNAMKYPTSIDSDRVKVIFAEDGGTEKDGIIEIRRGVKDLDLGSSQYAQVRILVDNTHYMKGVATYSDNMPPGIDILYNSKKSADVGKMGALKEISVDTPNNPFEGTYIKPEGQSTYIDKQGNTQLSAINKVNEQGDWGKWSHTLSSQFLSKQPMALVNKQLNLSYADKVQEYNDICAITNPTLKRKLLNDFAENCDAAAVELKAAGLPRQRNHVILPVPSLKDNEVYAPGYRQGEHVVLIRHPHGGTFEIPELVVNNKNEEAARVIGNLSGDAIGINHNVANRLSGADFDGDTVMVIPVNDRVKVKTSKPLVDLEGFDTIESYGPHTYEGRKVKLLSKKNKGNEMGKISNLITDMTIKGATTDEIARAVRHSMVVIDAPKHKLDYQRSYSDNDIESLKRKYMLHINEEGKESMGASTIISQASAEKRVLKRKGQPNLNPVTGEKTYKETSWIDPKTGELKVRGSKEVVEKYIDKKTGKEVTRMITSTKMAETNDAMTLVSDRRAPVELAYAKYANQMKSLANTARKEMMATPKLTYSAEARKTYEPEVKKLLADLAIAEKNAPRERQANILATSRAKARIEAEGIEDKEVKRKIKNQEIIQARIDVGARGKDTKITITDRQWEAIQAGAIHDTTLTKILAKTDNDVLRERAMPKQQRGLTSSQISLMNTMKASGFTLQEIADRLNVSTTTVSKNLKAS